MVRGRFGKDGFEWAKDSFISSGHHFRPQFHVSQWPSPGSWYFLTNEDARQPSQLQPHIHVIISSLLIDGENPNEKRLSRVLHTHKVAGSSPALVILFAVGLVAWVRTSFVADFWTKLR